MKVPMTPPGVHMVTELLEALDWDEEMLESLMVMFVTTLSDIKDPIDAERKMLQLKNDVSLLLGEEIAKMAINAFMVLVTHWSDKEIEA